MKTMEKLMAALMLVAGMISCTKDMDTQIKPLNLPLKTAEVITADNNFGLNLYSRLAGAARPDENLMISPLSISQALDMTYNGAAGETKTAMEETLNINGMSLDELNDLNKKLITALVQHDPKVLMTVANSIWYRQEYTVQPDFIFRNQTYYDAEVMPVDFSAPGCKDMINKWVSDKTNDRITQIVDQINPNSFMYLINAIWFKGAWKDQFDKKKTVVESFYPEMGDPVQVDMMHAKLDLNMMTTDDFTSVELPYGRGNWRMFLFLPEAGKKVADIEKILTAANWNSWMSHYDTVREVQFAMPKFTFSYDTSLKEVLSAMGMDVAFTDQADFSGIREGGDLLITDVRHKTFIEVTEEGTEAAAVTSVEVGVTSIGNFISFNRPFLFAIAEKSTGTILFVGRLMKP
jgi:serine protease inhibitor